MTQMDINFSILLFHIFLRNVIAFDKELDILYGFFNLRFLKKLPFHKKISMAPRTFFEFLFDFISKKHKILYKIAKFYVLNQSRSILLVSAKYTLDNQKVWLFFSVSDDVITQSRDLGRLVLVCQKLLTIFQVWEKFYFIWLSISDFNQGEEFLPTPLPLHESNIHQKAHEDQG